MNEKDLLLVEDAVDEFKEELESVFASSIDIDVHFYAREYDKLEVSVTVCVGSFGEESESFMISTDTTTTRCINRIKEVVDGLLQG